MRVMDKQWFVLHTLTGQENKAQKSIEVLHPLELHPGFNRLLGLILLTRESV